MATSILELPPALVLVPDREHVGSPPPAAWLPVAVEALQTFRDRD